MHHQSRSAARLRMLFAVLVVSTVGQGCVRYGRGRFQKSHSAKARSGAPVAASIRDLRGVFEPLYALRGAFFMVRLELIGMGKSRLAARLRGKLADAGWVATMLDRAEAGEVEWQLALDEICPTIGLEAQQVSLRAELERMRSGGAWRPGVAYLKEVVPTAGRLKQIGADLVAAVKRAPKALGRLPKTLKRMAAGMKRLARKTGEIVEKKGAKGKILAGLKVTVEAVRTTQESLQLYEEIEALPLVLEGIEREIRVISEARPPGLGEVDFERWGLVAGRFDAKHLLRQIRDAIDPPGCDPNQPVVLEAVKVKVASSKPRGGSWDPLGGRPDPGLSVNLKRVGRRQKNTRDAAWRPRRAFGAQDHLTFVVLDHDVLDHDPIVAVTVLAPHRPGKDKYSAQGTTVQWTLRCRPEERP